MVLAVTDHVEYYTSPNLRAWKKTGEFGKDAGAHGGVWECPDLFPMHDADGRTVWVQIVNINPGGPNGGSATQYFLGDFDGKTFTPTTAGTRWLDYGPDEYAGVTWSNTGNERIFLGWMSNWLYGQRVPTDPWRSANTLPRTLGLEKVGDSLYLTSSPWYHLDILHRRGGTKVNFPATLPKLAMIFLQTNKVASLDLIFSNDEGDSVTISYNDADHRYYIDRRHAGVPVGPDFDRIYSAPRLAQDPSIALLIYIDASSFELSADDGMTVMTALAFPHHPYTKIALRKPEGVELKYSWVVSMDGIHN
jgi:fructan beta-fructosidase